MPAALAPCCACLLLQGCDFEGGTFCFQSGTAPLQVQPAAGMLLVYTADDSNVHSVQEVSRQQAAPIMRLPVKPPGTCLESGPPSHKRVRLSLRSPSGVVTVQ
jgi:hypothetical protein